MEIVIFILWFLFCAGVGSLATSKGRSGLIWFLASVFLSPLVGIVLMCLPTNQKNVEATMLSSGNNKKCPYCAEIIKAEARTCRYCGKELYHATSTAQSLPLPPSTRNHKSQMYKVAKDGAEFAELTTDEIRDLVASNDLTLDDYFFDTRTKDWRAIRYIPDMTV